MQLVFEVCHNRCRFRNARTRMPSEFRCFILSFCGSCHLHTVYVRMVYRDRIQVGSFVMTITYCMARRDWGLRPGPLGNITQVPRLQTFPIQHTYYMSCIDWKTNLHAIVYCFSPVHIVVGIHEYSGISLLVCVKLLCVFLGGMRVAKPDETVPKFTCGSLLCCLSQLTTS